MPSFCFQQNTALQDLIRGLLRMSEIERVNVKQAAVVSRAGLVSRPN